MKRNIGFIGIAGLSTVLMSACGGQGDGMAAAPPSMTQALDTQQLLVLARQPSETSSPFVVDDGALTFTDTSDTSEPIDVNVM